MYETDENAFNTELLKILNYLQNDLDTADFGNYFATTYCSRVENWAFFNRKYIGINTNMYLEAFHKNVKYCYLEGKQCRRLDSLINALLLLVRDKFFERVIKITKQKKSSKLLKIISSHNKSVNISSNMITETEPNRWIITSETELNFEYIIEKCNVICDNCILRCDSCISVSIHLNAHA